LRKLILKGVPHGRTSKANSIDDSLASNSGETIKFWAIQNPIYTYQKICFKKSVGQLNIYLKNNIILLPVECVPEGEF
jgi:hypothetical protein